MNAAELNTELGKLIGRAMTEGIAQKKLSPLELIGTMEIQKADVIRYLQDLARAAEAKKHPGIYLPNGARMHPGS